MKTNISLIVIVLVAVLHFIKIGSMYMVYDPPFEITEEHLEHEVIEETRKTRASSFSSF